MLTLAIDTASANTSITLIKGDKVIAEKSWVSKQDEASKLLPKIFEIIPDINKVGRIVAVSGPGSFTGLRVGMTVANTLAYLLNAELYQISSFDIWKRRGQANAVSLIKGGRNELFVNGKLMNFQDALKIIKNKKVFGDLLTEQKEKLKKEKIGIVRSSELKSFGKALAGAKSAIKKVKIIEPNYGKKPQITISKDLWKMPRNQK